MTLFLFVALAASMGCFMSFTWGLYRHFNVQAQMPFSMRALSLLSLLAFIVFLALGVQATVAPWQIAFAIGLFIVSAALFWSAVNASRKSGLNVAHSGSLSHQVATTGPYRIFRHPFYVSYRVFWIATAIIGGPVSWAFALAFCLWYAILAHLEEKDLLQSELASSYAAYLSESGFCKLGGLRHGAPGSQKSFHPSLLARAVASLRTR